MKEIKRPVCVLRSPFPKTSSEKYGGECKQNAFNIKGLQEPYQIGEVRRFGEKLPEREDFKLAAAHQSAEVRWRMPAHVEFLSRPERIRETLQKWSGGRGDRQTLIRRRFP